MERPLMLAKKYEHLSNRDNEEGRFSHFQSDSNITALPTAQVKSGAVESLISQNEDLSARIKILLRRLSTIEEENLHLAQEHREMKNQLNGLVDQASVYREKESSWRERTILAEESLEIQQSQVRQKEIEFAKLRAQEWENRVHIQTQMEKIEKSYHRLLRYRSRIQRWIHPLLTSLSEQVALQKINNDQLHLEVEKTEIKCQNILQKNLDLLQKSRAQLKATEDEKLQIISQLETERRDLESEINSLRDSNDEFRKKAAKLDRSLERQDYLENRLIFAERENAELREKFTEEFTKVQTLMYEWRNKAQQLEIEQETHVRDHSHLTTEYQRKKEIADRLEEQMEAMRLLWQEKVKENEKLKNRMQTLEALNAELSLQINQLHLHSQPLV